jgi:hypothetical protein
MLQVQLSQNAIKKLLAQDPKTENKGGFQKLIVGLRRQLNPETGVLHINDSQVERIERYRRDYGRGGWQGVLDEVLKQAQKS